MKTSDFALIRRTLDGDQNAFYNTREQISEMGTHACLAENR